MDIRQLEIGWKLKARKEGLEEGRTEGRIETVTKLVDNNLISLSDAAKFLNITNDELLEQIAKIKEQH